MNYADWKTLFIDPLEIKLDKLNPRVILEDYTQENIRNFLIEYYDVIDLANSITKNNGMPPTERILCIKEGNEVIVVEGNRRVTACQILKKPELIPKGLRHKIANSKDIKNFLKQIEVVVAPNRDVTENYITLRHTGTGVKRWSRLAENRRYIIRYKDQNQSIRHISKVLDITEYNIRRGIQFYYFIEYVKDEISWTNEERKIINSPILETTKIDRFLPFSKPAKEIMTIYFDASHKLRYKIDKENFDKALKSIVERVFITNTINTRSTNNQVFTNEIKELCKIDKTQINVRDDHQINKDDKKETNTDTKQKRETSFDKKDEKKDEKKKGETTKKNTRRQPKPSQRKYPFEGINYDGDVIGISQTLHELHNINIKNFPFSTNVLIRTLLECTIQEYILFKNINIKTKKNINVKEISLDGLIKICANENNGNFKLLRKHNSTVARIIKEANGKRDADELNIVTHGVYREPSIKALWDIERRWYSAILIMVNEITGQT